MSPAMSNHSSQPSMSSSLATCLDPQPVPPSSHPLSPDPDDSSPPTLHTSPPIPHHLESWKPTKCRPASIRSVQHEPSSTAKKTHSPTHMRRSTSSQGTTKPPNERNLIFDEWITSTAHPHLAAHSLIPSELVDDDKAVQDMLAEAMNDEHFLSMPGTGDEEEEEVEEVVEVIVEERPTTPMSAVDIPAKTVEVTTRPRSSSSLSLRKWAGMFVGRGERPARPASGSHSQGQTTRTPRTRRHLN